MKLPGSKKNTASSGSALSHAFGASGQTREEILGSSYVPPAEPSAAEKAGVLLSGLKQKAAGLASQVHIPHPGQSRQGGGSAQAADGYPPQEIPYPYEMPPQNGPYAAGMPPQTPEGGWYNPFTDPAPPPQMPYYGQSYAQTVYEPAYAQGYAEPGVTYVPEYGPSYGGNAPEYTQPYGADAAGYAPPFAGAEPPYAPSYPPQEAPYAPEAPAQSESAGTELPDNGQPVFNMNGEIIAYAPPYYDTAGNLLGFAQPCFDGAGNLVGFAPPAVVGQPAAPSPRARTPVDLRDLRYSLWAVSIVLGMTLTLVSFVYACAI